MAAKTKQPDTPAKSLVEVAFAQMKELGTGEELSRLFPSGFASVELDAEAGGAKVSLRITAPAAGGSAAASVDDDVHILLDTDVVATFNAEGHRVVALIAKHDLSERFSASWAKVQKVLDNGHRDLLAAATFPDDVLRNTQPQTKPFHFIDIIFETGGPANPPLPAAPHLLSKLAQSTTTLKNGGTAQLMVDELSWLIHLIGDVHQPLHCITHVTPSHPRPQGDRGGNSFKLKGSPNNLHSVWDSCVSFSHNLDDDALALSIIQEHSRQQLATDLAITDPEKWARSSFNLAKQFVYAPLHENPSAPPKLTAAYLKQAEKIGRKQAALAGYRLADRFRSILG